MSTIAKHPRIDGRWWPIVLNEDGEVWVRKDLEAQAEELHAGMSGLPGERLERIADVLMQPAPFEPHADDPLDGLAEVDPTEGPYEPQEVRAYVRFELTEEPAERPEGARGRWGQRGPRSGAKHDPGCGDPRCLVCGAQSEPTQQQKEGRA